MPFDPLVFGMPPNSLTVDRAAAAVAAGGGRVRHLADAGYADRPFDRERTAAILGIGGGGARWRVLRLPLVPAAAGHGAGR